MPTHGAQSTPAATSSDRAPTEPGPARVNIRTLAFVLIGLSVLVPLASAGVLLGVKPDISPVAALFAIIPAVLGALVGLVLLTSMRAQTSSPGTFTLICLVGGAARMLSSVAFALAVYLTLEPSKVAFWGVFLVTALIVLIAETVMLMSSAAKADAANAINAHSAGVRPAESDASVGGNAESHRSTSNAHRSASEQAA